jgi:hypothetical protein
MMKLIENMFFKNKNSHIAHLSFLNKNSDRFNIHQSRGIVEVHNVNEYDEVKTNIQENDWSSLNFMQWFIKEQTDEELFSTPNIDSLKIGGNGKTKEDARYSPDIDTANNHCEDRFEQDSRSK